MGQVTTVPLFIEVLPQKYAKFAPKSQSMKKIVCLEQQIYASQENFTPTLLVMLGTFRRSDIISSYSRIKKM